MIYATYIRQKLYRLSTRQPIQYLVDVWCCKLANKAQRETRNVQLWPTHRLPKKDLRITHNNSNFIADLDHTDIMTLNKYAILQKLVHYMPLIILCFTKIFCLSLSVCLLLCLCLSMYLCIVCLSVSLPLSIFIYLHPDKLSRHPH